MDNNEYLGLSEQEIQEQFLKWNEETQKWERKAKLEVEPDFRKVTGEFHHETDENGKIVIDNESSTYNLVEDGTPRQTHEIHPTTESDHYKESKKKAENSMLVDYLANIDFTIIKKPEYKDEDELNPDEEKLFQDLKATYSVLVPTASYDSTPFDLLLKANPGMTESELDQKFLAIEGFQFEPEPEEETKSEVNK